MNKIKKTFIYFMTIVGILNASCVFAMKNNKPEEQVNEKKVDSLGLNSVKKAEISSTQDKNLNLSNLSSTNALNKIEKNTLNINTTGNILENKVDSLGSEILDKKEGKDDELKNLEIRKIVSKLLHRYYITYFFRRVKTYFSDYESVLKSFQHVNTDFVFRKFFTEEGLSNDGLDGRILLKLIYSYYDSHICLPNGRIVEKYYLAPKLWGPPEKDKEYEKSFNDFEKYQKLQYAVEHFNKVLQDKISRLSEDDFLNFRNYFFKRFCAKYTEFLKDKEKFKLPSHVYNYNKLCALGATTRKVEEILSSITFEEYKNVISQEKISMKDFGIKELEDVREEFEYEIDFRENLEQIKEKLYTLLFNHMLWLNIERFIDGNYIDNPKSFIEFLHKNESLWEGKQLDKRFLINKIFKWIYNYYSMNRGIKINKFRDLQKVLEMFNEKVKNIKLLEKDFDYIKQSVLKYLKGFGCKESKIEKLREILNKITLKEYNEKVKDMKISIKDIDNLRFKPYFRDYEEDLYKPEGWPSRTEAKISFKNNENLLKKQIFANVLLNRLEDIVTTQRVNEVDFISSNPNLNEVVSFNGKNFKYDSNLLKPVYINIYSVFNPKDVDKKNEELKLESKTSLEDYFRRLLYVFTKENSSEKALQNRLKKAFFKALKTISDLVEKKKSLSSEEIKKVFENKYRNIPENFFTTDDLREMLDNFELSINNYFNVEFLNKLIKDNLEYIVFKDSDKEFLKNFSLKYGVCLKPEEFNKYLNDGLDNYVVINNPKFDGLYDIIGDEDPRYRRLKYIDVFKYMIMVFFISYLESETAKNKIPFEFFSFSENWTGDIKFGFIYKNLESREKYQNKVNEIINCFSENETIFRLINDMEKEKNGCKKLAQKYGNDNIKDFFIRSFGGNKSLEEVFDSVLINRDLEDKINRLFGKVKILDLYERRKKVKNKK